MHIASEVEGNIRDDKDAFDAVEAVLPAGTLSGAPKIRACEIIEELEQYPRGIYGGALGYVDFNGNLDVAIAIRMAVKKKIRFMFRQVQELLQTVYHILNILKPTIRHWLL